MAEPRRRTSASGRAAEPAVRRPLYPVARPARPMAQRRVPRPATRRFTLRNGLKVVLAPNPDSPTASVWVWYRVGSVNERPGITGASHWVEHMLFEGSPRYGKGEIDRAVVRVGGELNAFTDVDFTAYYTTVPREHLDIPLDIEADRMTRALITDDEVARERTVIFSEREGNENWPEFRVEEELFQLAFREHPYRWDALGRREDIEQMSAAQLREYYHRFYGTRNAILVVAGGFDASAVARQVRTSFGRLPAGGEPIGVRAVEPPQRGERRSELSGPGTTPYLQVGFRAPALEEPQTPATIVLDTILGGETRLFASGAGMGRSGEHPSSRLYRGLVDPGLAVHATCDWRPRRYAGLFTIQAQAARGIALDRLERALLRLLDRLAHDGPTAREVAESRIKLRRSAILAYEGASRTGFRLGYFSVLRSPELEDEIFSALLRVTPRQVRDRARELFHEDGRLVVRYRPTGTEADG